jgi:PAS domain S-box-containing protein
MDPEIVPLLNTYTRDEKPGKFELYVHGINKWLAISVYFPEKEHFVIIFDNISDRKFAEEAKREHQERYRAISEYSHSAICIVNDLGKITWCNDKLIDMGGYSREEIYGAESFAGFIAPESLAFVIPNFQKVMAQQPYEHHYTFLFIRKDGEIRTCEKHMMHYVDTAGKINLIINMSDVTELKRAEEALIKSDFMHRSMTANISDVIVIIDKTASIVYESPNIERLFGWKPEDLVGTKAWDRIHPDDLTRIQTDFSELLKKDKAIKTVEYWFKCKSGNYRQIEMTGVNLLSDPAINGILINYHDITERKLD